MMHGGRTAIVTSVNIDRVSITGLEAVLEIRPSGPFSGYLNVAINHALREPSDHRRFFPPDSSPGYFDLDHDQRVSGVASAVLLESWALSVCHGDLWVRPHQRRRSRFDLRTRLVRLHTNTHVDPNFIVNASAGYSFAVGRAVVRPQLYVDNVLIAST